MIMLSNEEIIANLKNMHPTAGCELNYTSAYELLVAVILSAQCTDKRVNIATSKLFANFNTPVQIAKLQEIDLKPYIFSCGFYNSKAKHIISMSKSLLANFGGMVPQTMEELLTLDGVGRKTASVILSVFYDIPAVPVDTHVFRVSRRLRLSDGNTVEKVEKDLMNKFSSELWNPLHHLLIFHGRYLCHSQNPNCSQCKLNTYCPFYLNGDFNAKHS